MKRLALGLLLASVGAVVLTVSWLGGFFDDAEDVWS